MQMQPSKLPSVSNNCVGIPSIVELNVGGRLYTTSLSALTRYSDSLLSELFNDRQKLVRDGQGRFFIDRNGDLFGRILDYIRTGTLLLPTSFNEMEALLEEAKHFKLKSLVEEVEERIA